MLELTERDKRILNSTYELTVDQGEEELILFEGVVLDVYYEGKLIGYDDLFIPVNEAFGKLRTNQNQFYFFYRHVLFYQTYSYSSFIKRLDTIIQDCKKQGLKIYDYIKEYFIIPPGGYVIYDPATQDHWGVAKRNPQPTCTWRFLDVETIDPQSTDFDEKIEVNVSWLDNRVRQEFKGYWYVTSHGFIDRHTAQHDPYYRRCILVCDTFNPEYVNQQLDLMMRYLATRSMEARIDCLKYHFEYDGQLMFYER